MLSNRYFYVLTICLVEGSRLLRSLTLVGDDFLLAPALVGDADLKLLQDDEVEDFFVFATAADAMPPFDAVLLHGERLDCGTGSSDT